MSLFLSGSFVQIPLTLQKKKKWKHAWRHFFYMCWPTQKVHFF